MTDEQIIQSAPIVDVISEVSPIASTAPEVPNSPVIESAPVLEAALAIETSTAPEVPKSPVDVTILGENEPKVDANVINPPESITVEDATKNPELNEFPIYESFELPEGITISEEQVQDFNKLLGEFEVSTKADRSEVQKFGQNLINKHISEVQQVSTRLQEQYQNAWEKQKSEWYTQFENDAEMGGNRKDTTKNLVLNAIKNYGGSEEQQSEFRELMTHTGIGNAPPLIRTIANLAKEISSLKARYEGESSVKQLAATKPESTIRSKIETRYGREA